MSGKNLPEVDMEDPGLPGGPGGPGNPSPRQKGHKQVSGMISLSSVNKCVSELLHLQPWAHLNVSKCRLVSLFSPHTSTPVSIFHYHLPPQQTQDRETPFFVAQSASPSWPLLH